MAGDLAAKQARAEQLRTELSGLRVERTTGHQAGQNAALEAKLDDEIAQLEKQVAIEREMAASGGSAIDAMAAMEAARLEEEVAAKVTISTSAKKVETLPVQTSLTMGLVTPTGGTE